mmetsp:Transcript_89251/g.177445  ORF Transcript_89251/g.177445 Transcript_89251/m.177445 type:complete len:212 (-) Transcript_89251:226-861(-)
MGICPSCHGSNDEHQDQFAVSVTREPGMPLGLELDFMDLRTGHVVAVLPEGAVQKTRANLKAGDHIVSANGSSIAIGIMERLKEDETIDIVVERTPEFRVKVAKGASGLGLDLTNAPKGTSLLVRNIIPAGAIEEWNSKNKGREVQKMDRVVEVNGVRGEWSKLLEALRTEESLNIVFSAAPTVLREPTNHTEPASAVIPHPTSASPRSLN